MMVSITALHTVSVSYLRKFEILTHLQNTLVEQMEAQPFNVSYKFFVSNVSMQVSALHGLLRHLLQSCLFSLLDSAQKSFVN